MRKFRTAEEKAYRQKMTGLTLMLILSIVGVLIVCGILMVGFQTIKQKELEKQYYADYPSSAIIKILEN